MVAGGRPKPQAHVFSRQTRRLLPLPADCPQRRPRRQKGASTGVIATLGRLDLLQASGQLERLLRSGLRHCQAFAVLDAHAAGELEPVSVLRLGADLVFGRLWQESGLPEALRAYSKVAVMASTSNGPST
jgi:hypothetical protein